MRTIMARTPHESSFSFSKRHFQRIIGKGGGGEERKQADGGEAEEEFLAFSNSSSNVCDDEPVAAAPPPARKRGASSAAVAVSRFRSVIAAAIARRHRLAGLGPRVTGTLFGHRRGHVHFAFQVDPRSCPVSMEGSGELALDSMVRRRGGCRSRWEEGHGWEADREGGEREGGLSFFLYFYFYFFWVFFFSFMSLDQVESDERMVGDGQGGGHSDTMLKEKRKKVVL